MDVDAAVAALRVVHGVVRVGARARCEGRGCEGFVVGRGGVVRGGVGSGRRCGRSGEGAGAEAVGEGGVAA